MPGLLKKMILKGFKDDKFRKPTFLVYEAVVNPETYTHSYQVVLSQVHAQGVGGESQTVVRMAPRKMDFEFLFDSTGALTPGDGALSPASRLGVWEQVELFKQTIYDFNGDTHRTPYVVLTWGTLIFKCQVEAISITYKLFKPDGTPIRAVAKVAFVEVFSDGWRVLREDAKSADLTHVRTVVAGDNLPLLCYQVYGDATLYREVARVNQLVNFRTLPVGRQLFFPPLVAATP